MQTKIGNRIVLIGETIIRKKRIPSRKLIVSPPTASHRIIIIKDGEFVRSRPRR